MLFCVGSLPANSIVVMDNLSPHKTSRIATLIEDAGAWLWYLPPYSPDFNPIEQMWSKIKSALRAAKTRTYQELCDAIATALAEVPSDDTRGFFRHSVVGIIS